MGSQVFPMEIMKCPYAKVVSRPQLRTRDDLLAVDSTCQYLATAKCRLDQPANGCRSRKILAGKHEVTLRHRMAGHHLSVEVISGGCL